MIIFHISTSLFYEFSWTTMLYKGIPPRHQPPTTRFDDILLFSVSTGTHCTKKSTENHVLKVKHFKAPRSAYNKDAREYKEY